MTAQTVVTAIAGTLTQHLHTQCTAWPAGNRWPVLDIIELRSIGPHPLLRAQ